MSKATDLKGILSAMAGNTSTKTIEVPAKGMTLTVKDLTFKELKVIEAKGKDIESKQDSDKKADESEAIIFMLQNMVLSIEVGEHSIHGSPLFSESTIRQIVEQLNVDGLKEISEGVADVLGMGKLENP